MNVSSRWLEGYLVRYFMGTIVGSLCCLIVISAIVNPLNIESPLKSAASSIAEGKIDPTSFLVLACLGFLYCYIASTPITVIHAARMLGALPKRWFFRPATMWVTWWTVTTIFISGRLIDVYQQSPINASIESALAPLLATPAFYIIFAQWAPVTAVLRDLDKLKNSWIATFFHFVLNESSKPRIVDNTEHSVGFIEFYSSLSESRTANSTADDFRTSYSHLREHSNSIFIVLLEASLAALLTGVCLLMSGHTWLARATTVTTILLLWIMPTVFVWGIANSLERHLSRIHVFGPRRQ